MLRYLLVSLIFSSIVRCISRSFLSKSSENDSKISKVTNDNGNMTKVNKPDGTESEDTVPCGYAFLVSDFWNFAFQSRRKFSPIRKSSRN